MWYEILPSLAIVFAGYYIPSVAGYWTNKLILGNHYKRDLRQEYEHYFYVRDLELTGDVYKQNGLEVIPDAEPEPSPKK